MLLNEPNTPTFEQVGYNCLDPLLYVSRSNGSPMNIPLSLSL